MNSTQSTRAAESARVRSEQPIDLLTAATIFPRSELWRTVSVKSLRRWIIGGKRGVRLGGTRIGGELYTSRAAIDRFIAAVAALEPLKHSPA